MISYFAHLGIVRVLSVPIMMALLIYAMYVLAAPPEEFEEDNEHEQSPKRN